MRSLKSFPMCLVLMAVVVVFVAGCAGTPRKNVALEEARVAYIAAQSSPQVAKNASLELKRAEQALRESETLWRKGADQKKVEHYAYLAKQRTAIAQEVAIRKMAEEAIARAGEDRAKAQLEVRMHEAELAKRDAAARAREVELARQLAQSKDKEAALALQREAELARQLADAHKERGTRMAGPTAEAEMAEERSRRLERLDKQIAELRASQTERGLVVAMGDLLFDQGGSQLKPGAMLTIGRLARFLKENPGRTVMVEGFTDSIGGADYNLRLSERRANAVRNTLVVQGVDPMRVMTRGYGEAFPVASNNTEAGRQLNRRVEVIISGEAGRIPPRTS